MTTIDVIKDDPIAFVIVVILALALGMWVYRRLG